MTCDIMRERSSREAHYRLSDQGYFGGLVTETLSIERLPKVQSPRRKVVVQHKPHYFCKQFRHSIPL